jgi:hypothetical protein
VTAIARTGRDEFRRNDLLAAGYVVPHVSLSARLDAPNAVHEARRVGKLI